MTASDSVQVAPASSPFDLDDENLYQTWRRDKLARVPRGADDLVVELHDARQLSPAEYQAMNRALARANMVFYRLPRHRGLHKADLRALGRQFGLQRLDNNLCADEDSITSLRVVENRGKGEYIPYSNQRLNWHTDGYYNASDQQVRAVILHCVQPAAQGGDNAFLDHELAYIRLRDQDPELVRALMAADAMTIPANVQGGREIRPAHSGPVFSVDAAGRLHMRYSARTRNVVWRSDPATQAAVQALGLLFRDDSPFIVRHRLKSGEGVLSSNVLHSRSAFVDDDASGQVRLLYRARYLDRVADSRDER
jgi:alpha-ketoglutarate-dependent taurine dioxygenase